MFRGFLKAMRRDTEDNTAPKSSAKMKSILSAASLGDELRDYALRRRDEVLERLRRGGAIARRENAFPAAVVEALGPRAEEAQKILDRLAMGAAAEIFAAGEDGPGAGDEFTGQVDHIIAGFDHVRLGSLPVAEEVGRPRIFQSELWQLLHKVRESAELAYAREGELVELDRRILLLLKGKGPLVPADLSSAVGADKAQVSRSVKRLLELKIIEREQIRSPILLTHKGDGLAHRLLRLAELRHRELSFDIDDQELQAFIGVTDILLERAVALYEKERELARGSDGLDGTNEMAQRIDQRRIGEQIVIDNSRIVPPLLTLSAYFSRSGALAMKRKTGLSNFESWVLSEIGDEPPTYWSKLVKALDRDHSQAGRTVNHLIERGLVIREGKPGRRHGSFRPTEEGLRLYEIIQATGQKRSDFLMQQIPADHLSGFLETFEKLRRNASAQLERERALDELERD